MLTADPEEFFRRLYRFVLCFVPRVGSEKADWRHDQVKAAVAIPLDF